MKKLVKVIRKLSESNTGSVAMAIQKRLNVPTVFGFIPILMILFCWSCQSSQSNMEDDQLKGSEELKELKGTTWKLVGKVNDVKTGIIKELSPKN